MDPSDAINIIVLFVLVLLSAFFSSAETAIISVNKIRIRSMVEEEVKNAALVAKITEDSRKFISTVLIGNNVVNISASALATTFVLGLFGNVYVGIGTGILTMVIRRSSPKDDCNYPRREAFSCLRTYTAVFNEVVYPAGISLKFGIRRNT